jgi:hypothetical protein
VADAYAEALEALMFPKPEPLARTRRRKVRIDNTAQRMVRRAVFAREQDKCAVVSRLSKDEMLAVFKAFGICHGPLQLMHAAGHRRSQTRGLPPEERHSTETCLAGCAHHHDCEERRGLRFVAQTDQGYNGPLTYAVATPKGLVQ